MNESQSAWDNKELNERLALANEELKINNEELAIYKAQLEEMVAISTQELKRSEEKFSNVFHHSPCYIIVSSPVKGLIMEVNETFTRHFGYTSAELSGKALTDLNIVDKGQYRKAASLIKKQGYYNNIEITFFNRNKEKVQCLASGEKVEAGPHQFIIETISNITEVKQIEARLSLTETRFSNFIEQSGEGVAYFIPTRPVDTSLPAAGQARRLLSDCRLAECNDAYRHIHGYEAGSSLAEMTIMQISGEIVEDDWLNILKLFIESGYRLTDYQAMDIGEDGSEIYYLHNLTGIIQSKRLVGLWISSRNITDLKKAEEAIRYKSVLENLIAGLSTRFFNMSPELLDESIETALHEICGFIDADSGFLIEIRIQEGYYKLTHQWTNEMIKYDPGYFAKAPVNELYEWYLTFSQKDYFLVTSPSDIPDKSYLQGSFSRSGVASMILLPIKFQGHVLGILGVSTLNAQKKWSPDEISMMKTIGETFFNTINRKNSQLILVENEKKYREIFNSTTEAILLHDAKTGAVIDANQAALDLFDIPHHELINAIPGKDAPFNLGFENPSFADAISNVADSKQSRYEWLATRKNGEKFWAEISLKCSEISGDLRIINVIRDFSDRRKNEEVIRQSEERFRSIIQYLTDGILILDENLTIKYESPSIGQLLGYAPSSMIGKNSTGFIHPEDLPAVLRDMKDVFAQQNDFVPTEFRAKHADGRWISLEAIANNMLDHPAIKGIIITARDVTERKLTEKALRISESKFRNIFNNSSDAVLILRNNFTIAEVNDVFLRISGYGPEEALSMKFTEIISDAYLPQVVDRMIRHFQNENLPAAICEIRLKSLQHMPVEINSKLIDFEGEKLLVSVLRDITERRQLENRILDTIITTEEKEREKFARNLHDELGPLLSSMKMYINSLSSVTNKEKHEFVISQLKQIATEAIQSTKELSNDLSPQVLANYGLVAAIEWFVNKIKPYILVNFETNLGDERFPSSMELSIYRIIKELINNTVKHADATSITIRLHVLLHSVHLAYSDDGKGFTENWQENFDSLGMGMSNILSRCRSVNALSKFYNHAPHGMSFEMDIQLDSLS